jgi:hypothetical protein
MVRTACARTAVLNYDVPFIPVVTTEAVPAGTAAPRTLLPGVGPPTAPRP